MSVERSLTASLKAWPRVRWQLSGPATIRGDFKQATDHDNSTIVACIPLVLAGCFYLLFGSWMGGFLIACSIVLMRTLLVGTMALCGAHLDPLSSCLVMLVALAAIEDFLFVTRYKMETKLAWRACYQRFIIPSLLTTLTTILGFLSLTLSNISNLRGLGRWAAYGAVVQWVVVFLLVPCLQAVWPRAQVWTKKPLLPLA